jgi:hypothetical protein
MDMDGELKTHTALLLILAIAATPRVVWFSTFCGKTTPSLLLSYSL